MRTALFLALTLTVSALGAQDRATVADYFVTSDRIGLSSGYGNGHWIWFDPDGPASDTPLAKQLLLQGVSLDIRHPVTNLIVDIRNGYLHFDVRDQSLTMVYYERADKSRIVGVRIETDEGQFPDVQWEFFNVSGSEWSVLGHDEILPPSWISAYFSRPMTSADRDFLSLTRFDIDLPRVGTTAHLIPEAYETDLDDASTMVKVPGTNRKVRLGTYYDWFERVFRGEKRNVRTLELKWNKPAGRFDAGTVAVWDPAPVKPEAPRSIYDVLHRPRNIWESFLANPELVYDGNDGLYWDPNRSVPDEEYRDASQDQAAPYEQKQELLSYSSLGLMEAGEFPPIVDLPARYLDLNLARSGPDPEGGDEPVDEAALRLTMRGFETSGKQVVIGYRFWGKTGSGAEQPKTEHNQIAACFYGYSPSGEPVAMNEGDVLPLDKINAFALGGTSKDQALQAAVIWDVTLPRTGMTLQLAPWRLAYLSPAQEKALVTLFGSKAGLEKAFQDFVNRWYGRNVLALDWDPKTERFGPPRMIKKP